jgi:AraC-like DNA-binding protein
VTYRERSTGLPGAVLWTKTTADPTPSRILPDGCVDLLWNGQRLNVAGPDTRARWHTSPPGTTWIALRLSAGAGPALLGIPADALRDRSHALDELWSSGDVRRLTARVADAPAAALTRWAYERLAACAPDPLGARLLALADRGAPVSVMADRLGLSERQLHRRCSVLFGYGPRHLTRVLRLQRALAAPGSLAEVAAVAGYADQAHLSRDARDLAGATPTELRQLRG